MSRNETDDLPTPQPLNMSKYLPDFRNFSLRFFRVSVLQEHFIKSRLMPVLC